MSTKSLAKLYSNGKNSINGNGAHKKTRKKVTVRHHSGAQGREEDHLRHRV